MKMKERIASDWKIALRAILTLNELIKFKSLDERITIGFIKKEIQLKKVLFIAFALTASACCSNDFISGIR